MFWRHRRVLRDRAAGMVFDWRRGHGSARRLLIGAIVSASFWGALLAYVQIRKPAQVELTDDQIDITLVDLDLESSRWLAEPIDRETLFHQRWDVSDDRAIAQAVTAALAEQSPRIYEPTLQEFTLPQPLVALENLPGYEAGTLPPPAKVDSVAFATPPANWWVRVEPIEGPPGYEPFEFPFAWPAKPELMSEGELWTIVLGVDWQGQVIMVEDWQRSGDERTPAILAQASARRFPALAPDSPIRIWRLEARLVNQPLGR